MGAPFKSINIFRVSLLSHSADFKRKNLRCHFVATFKPADGDGVYLLPVERSAWLIAFGEIKPVCVSQSVARCRTDPFAPANYFAKKLG
jgi:hypothetical protein